VSAWSSFLTSSVPFPMREKTAKSANRSFISTLHYLFFSSHCLFWRCSWCHTSRRCSSWVTSPWISLLRSFCYSGGLNGNKAFTCISKTSSSSFSLPTRRNSASHLWLASQTLAVRIYILITITGTILHVCKDENYASQFVQSAQKTNE
jgi:hypothetical protein